MSRPSIVPPSARVASPFSLSPSQKLSCGRRLLWRAMAIPYWTADTNAYPVIVVHLVGAPGPQQSHPESFVRVVHGIIEKREPVVVIYDLTGSRPDAQRRRLVVNWLKQNSESLTRYVLASAIVAPTPFHRGILVAIFWFIKPTRPVEVFADRPAAMLWSIDQSQRSGLTHSSSPYA
jgi:hypothetical protein